jgi:transcriptional regulator with XRE-family HTH domain
MPISHRSLLKRLGSNPEIAAALGLDHSTVSRWRTGGIPSRHWVAVARYAAKRLNMPVSAEDIASARVRPRSRAAPSGRGAPYVAPPG